MLDHRLVTIPPSVVSTRVGEDTLVHDMITQQFYRLNDVGSRIWELCDGGNVIAVIAQIISAEYRLPDDVPVTQLHDDVRAILADLHRDGLVTLSALERGS